MTTNCLPAESPFMQNLIEDQIKRGANPVYLRLRHAGIPPMFRKARFDRLDQSRDPEAFQICGGYAQGDQKRGLLLMGRPGNGKTTVAVATMRAWIEATEGQQPARFWEVSPGLEAIRRSFQDEDIVEDNVTDIAAKNDFLIIDDLGPQKTTDWVSDQFYQLLNALYTHEKHVIITTNLNAAGLRDQLHVRLVSRILGMCRQVVLTGPDRRI